MLGLDPDERWLCPLPLSHVGGLMVLLRSAIYATTAIIGPAERAADDDVTVASLVPTQLAAPARRRRPPRRAAAAGAARRRARHPRAAGARARRRLARPQTYGLTQACSQVTVAEPGDLDTAGRPLPGVGVTIAADGEILVDGPTVAGGGVLRTGDLGRLDAQRRLIVTGRKSDTIVTGGENVAPAEVEAVLLEHPAVADAGVYGRPDPEWGQAVTARVVLRTAGRAGGAAPLVPRAAGRLQGSQGDRAGGRASPHAVWEAVAPGAVTSDERQESRARWGRAAKGWGARAEEMRRATMPVSAWMVDALGPQPGDTLLELAAGPGDTGFLAAELIRPGGTLICSDFSPEMLTVAQERASALGLDNVRFRQIDAEAPLDIQAASLDGVLCRWGYMLMTEPVAALQETRRVLKRGARAALAAWTGPEDNLWSALPGRELVRHGLVEPPEPGAPGQFTWGPEGEIAENLEAAGFVDYEIATVDFTYAFPSFEEWWQSTRELSSRFAEAAAQMDAETAAEVEQALREAAKQFTGEDGMVTIPARTWVAVATA